MSITADARGIIDLEHLLDTGAIVVSDKLGGAAFNVRISHKRYGTVHGRGTTFPEALAAAMSEIS